MVYIQVTEDKELFGSAIRHPSDRNEKAVGRLVALKRALQGATREVRKAAFDYCRKHQMKGIR
jgi:hypothetical protein